MAVGPGAGPALASFLDAYYRSGEARRRQQEADDIAQMRAVQLADFDRQQRERSSVRAAIPTILSAPPETATIRPALPGRTVTSLSQALLPGEDPEAAALIPRVTTTLPGTPAVTESAPTMRSIAAALPPDQLALAMTTPEGQAALKTRGVLTNEEFERRQKVSDARETYKDSVDRALEAFAAGESQKGLLAQAAGLRAMMNVVDAAHVPQLQAKVDEITKMYLAAQKDATEQARQDEDAARFSTAMRRYQTSGDPMALVDFVGSAKSHAFRKVADDFAKTMAAGPMEAIQHPNLAAFYKRVGQLWDKARQTGQVTSMKDVYQRALTDVPQALGDFVRIAAEGKHELPGNLGEAVFGRKVPKTELELADRYVREAKGLTPEAPGYAKELFQIVSALKEAGRRPEKDTTVAELNTYTRNVQEEIRGLETEYRNLQAGLPKGPDRVTQLAMAGKDQASVQEKWAATERRMAEITQEIGTRRASLREALSQIGAIVTPKAAAKAGTAPAAPTEPVPAVPSAPPATTAATDAKRAMPPPINATKQDAVREKERLLGLGHTLESAREAMRQVGW